MKGQILRRIHALGQTAVMMEEAFLSLFLPRYCRECGTRMESSLLPVICDECWSKTEWIREPFCFYCGIPVGYGEEAGFLEGKPICGECRLHPPRYDLARSLGVYDGVLRGAVHELKYRHRVSLGPPLGKMMGEYLLTRALEISIARIERVIPVPLGPQRFREREFNQSELLAREVARMIDRPLDTRTLRRVKEGIDQQGLPRKERFANIKGAFEAERGIAGGVLLIDDVMTTGATLDAAVSALKKAGARGCVWPIYCLTLGRTPRSREAIG